MAWVQVTDDGEGTTPQSYTDADGDSTSMTVYAAGGQPTPYYYAGPPSYWIIGDDSQTAAELHGHSFAEPAHVLRVDISYLDSGDFANFAYEDVDGNVKHIDLNQWIEDGNAVVRLGAGHSVEQLPANPDIKGLKGSKDQPGEPDGTSEVEFYFPVPVKAFYVGRNAVQGELVRNAYAYQLYYDDHDSFVSDEPLPEPDPEPYEPRPIRKQPGPGESRAPCFTSGTLIGTDTGEKAVEALRAGDRVRTMDHGLQEIRWIGGVEIPAADLAANPKLLPVRIRAGSLGQDLPQRDLLVSRQHRILVNSNIVQRMFGTSQILIPAISLVGIDGIEIASDVDSIIYWHILFDRHEIIFAEETPTESLFTGPEALKSVPADVRKEIEALFPQLLDPNFSPPPARLIPAKTSQIRQLVARHTRHPMRPLSS